MPVYKKSPLVGKLRRQPCTSVQVLSHVATFYVLGCFAVFVQPSWFASEMVPNWAPILVGAFWVIFVFDVALYSYCLCTDTRYLEALPGMPESYPEIEPRKCDDCGTDVSEPRVKHCQTCGWCMEAFDHHCRYLNVCVGGRTYPAWYFFVLLLLTLVVICAFGNVHALMEPLRHHLHDYHPVAFFLIIGSAAVVTHLEGLFLFALLAQHSYFCLAGITTLEYIKDQDPPFPSLPPRGWREAVSEGECHSCQGLLGLTDAPDADEVLYCSICQGDLAKACVGFYQCDVCDAAAVCPICYRAASSSSTVTTYRASALRRRSQALLGVMDSTRHGGGSSKNHTPSVHSRLSSLEGEQLREVRTGRRSMGAMVAAVEGHAGERSRFVSPCCGRREEQESESESSTEEGAEN